MDSLRKIRINRNGIQRLTEVDDVITEFGLESSEESSDDEFDVQEEVAQMYNAVLQGGQEGLEESYEESDEELVLDDGKKEKRVKEASGHNYRWRKRVPTVVQTPFTGPQFSPPPHEILSPYEYFKLFIDQSMIDNCFEQTNLYAAQKAINKNGKLTFSTTCEKIEQYFGILLHMGVTKFPSYRMFWSNETRIPSVSNVMPRNEFELIKSNLHFNDNSLMPEKNDEDYDRLYKVRPFIAKLRENCLQIEPEEKQSIDEMIIPTKTRWGIRQYNPKKPNKWGIKNWARCGVSGIMYDFSVYTGKTKDDTVAENLGVSAAVVANLCSTLPKKVGHKVYCDNYFTTPDLFIHLQKEGIFCVGTVRSNRLKGAQKLLKAEKELKKDQRGSFDYVVDANSSLW